MSTTILNSIAVDEADAVDGNRSLDLMLERRQAFWSSSRLKSELTTRRFAGQPDVAIRERLLIQCHAELAAGNIPLSMLGDRSTRDCTLLVLRMPVGSDSYVVGSGRYSDQLVRTPDGWKFAFRKVHVRDLKAT